MKPIKKDTITITPARFAVLVDSMAQESELHRWIGPLKLKPIETPEPNIERVTLKFHNVGQLGSITATRAKNDSKSNIAVFSHYPDANEHVLETWQIIQQMLKATQKRATRRDKLKGIVKLVLLWREQVEETGAPPSNYNDTINAAKSSYTTVKEDAPQILKEWKNPDFEMEKYLLSRLIELI